MKTFILFMMLIDYINGSPYSFGEFQRHTTTDSYASSKSDTNIFAILTGLCEETEDNISLNLSYTGLQRIHEKFINNSHITCLNLSNNNIIYVSPTAFELLPNLTYLNLANNRVSVPAFRLSVKNSKLKTLVLDNNHFGDQNSIFNFHDTFSNIEHLYLRQNSLNSFSNTNIFLNLRHLYLSDNIISSVDKIIGEIPRSTLTYLYLERNSIRHVNGTTLYNLEYLALDGNRIESLCNQYCHNSWLSLNRMTKLKHLSLSGNQITEIESDSFLETSNLITLDLSNNRITTIRKDTLKPLTMLEVLSLSGNRLTTFPEFFPLINIQNFTLVNNNLASIPTELFSDFRVLKYLSLSNNYISNVEKRAFLNLISLEELDLSNNRIENLPEEWMTPQNRIRNLNLEDNYFTDFKNLSLENAESLENIFLQRNAIEVLNVASFLNVSEYVSIHIEDQSKRRLSNTKKDGSSSDSTTFSYEYATSNINYRYDDYYN
ncbi:leucine-rich repeat-containing protein 15-like [Belonocnema kinseyi]|uniref:leucine-rich repeat-containing protein 15-like n=1 Tax=Belonocnema kinseyi TaxID=2817044 RepID=UPI00143CD4A6|nr:leucine-rich repeat-containing protein 15-like [Belonocnema kinseyi]